MTALSKYILTSLKPYRSPHRQCTGSLTVSPVASDQPRQQHKPIIDKVMIESPQGYGVGQKVLGDPHGRPNTKDGVQILHGEGL